MPNPDTEVPDDDAASDDETVTPIPMAEPFVLTLDSDATSDLVSIEATPGGAVTMNRPEKKNAFNAELIGALRETFETLRDQEALRVVFVQGAGGTFSAGADLE